jgi:hypothetical protein
MTRRTLLFIVGFIALVQGCSSETVKRTSFETLQNIREQECEKDLSGKCPPRESYDDYQRKRKEAQATDNGNNVASPSPAE